MSTTTVLYIINNTAQQLVNFTKILDIMYYESISHFAAWQMTVIAHLEKVKYYIDLAKSRVYAICTGLC